MSTRILTTAALWGLATIAAYAGAGVDRVRWCENDTGAPMDALSKAALDPHGQPRGSRSGADLYVQGRSAAVAGHPEAAIAWIKLCLWHDPSAQQEVALEQGAVLDYLRR